MMRETSTAQYEANRTGGVPPFEQVRPNVWALPLAMPSVQLPYVISYLVLDDRGFVHVIDPGWDSDENWQRVLAALESIGSALNRVASVTLTHLHRDHVGMTHRYREATPARIQLSRVEQAAIWASTRGASEEATGVATTSAATTAGASAAAAQAGAAPAAPTASAAAQTAALTEAWGVPAERRAELEVAFGAREDQIDVAGDVLLDDGDDLGVPGSSIRVIATPGHTYGSISLAAANEQLLFTGDHVLPAIFAGVGLGGPTASNPVSDYVESLEKLQPFDAFEVLPGHGYRFTGLAERRAESAEHHLKRSREAAAVVAANPSATIWEVASQLHWTAGWENLHGPFLRSALAQTAWHVERAPQAR
jgi:glyoxylase-like metal-dependent hydrolase (beta-lactamase superfamily II)